MSKFKFHILILLLQLIFSCASKNESPYKIRIGSSKLPRLPCNNLDGNKETIIHRDGEILVLNFWGTGCMPCILEIPGFNKLVEKYKSHDNIRFIAIHPSYGRIEKLKLFLKRNRFDFEQKICPISTEKILNVGMIPHTFICNQEGIVLYSIVGGHAEMYKYIDKIIETLLNGGILYYENK